MDGFQWSELIPRFPHIAEEIFEKLDDQSITRLGWFKSCSVKVKNVWQVKAKEVNGKALPQPVFLKVHVGFEKKI